MTLRRRLVLALMLLTLTALVVGAGVVVAERRAALGRLDDQLTAVAADPRLVILAAERGDRRGDPVDLLGDFYIARRSPQGRLVTIAEPVADPDLVPRIGSTERPLSPVTRTSATGIADHVRVVTVGLTGGGTLIVATPTTPVDRAVATLALTLAIAAVALAAVVGLIVWWVVRLGLRPIAALTTVADEIAAGRTDRTLPPGPPGSEADRLGQAMGAMLASREEAGERMRLFVADASHELRTPLTTILGYSSPGASTTAGTTQEQAGSTDAMRRIHEEARRMRRLVDQLLTLTTLDVVPVAARQPVDVGALLQDIGSDLRIVQPERPVVVDVVGDVIVAADRDLLLQAVTGVTSNATRHTPSDATIRLSARTTANGVRIEVADTGPGISAEHLPHLFDRFYRVDSGRSSGTGGTGLGLALVASIVRAHGGQVQVSSTPGRGSTFVLTFPSLASH